MLNFDMFNNSTLSQKRRIQLWILF